MAEDMNRNESNLVPKPGQAPNLEAMRSRLLAPQAAPGGVAARPRRIRRARNAWAVSVACGAVLSAAGAFALLGLPSPRAPRPASPDAGLDRAGSQVRWDVAGYETSTFQSLMGLGADDPARREAEARRLERLLTRRAHPGLD
jgi:hypothetical protein